MSITLGNSVTTTGYSHRLLGTRSGRVLLMATLSLACAVGASTALQGPQMATSAHMSSLGSPSLASSSLGSADREVLAVEQQVGQQVEQQVQKTVTQDAQTSVLALVHR